MDTIGLTSVGGLLNKVARIGAGTLLQSPLLPPETDADPISEGVRVSTRTLAESLHFSCSSSLDATLGARGAARLPKQIER